MKNAFRMVAFFIVLSVLAPPAFAGERTADQIMKDSYEHQLMDFNAATADMKMELIDNQKVYEVREVRTKAMRIKKDKEDLRYILLTFLKPDDVAGMAFLSRELPGGADDDQFLYMPAIKRALRKGGKTGKSESFLGTQFTYGDMESKDVDESTHKRLPDEKVGPVDCFVIESVPKDPEKNKYSKYVNYINKKTSVPQRIKLFDMKGKLQKVMMTEKVELIDKKETITRMTMLNVQTNKATRIALSNIDTKAKLDEADFTKERMTKL